MSNLSIRVFDGLSIWKHQNEDKSYWNDEIRYDDEIEGWVYTYTMPQEVAVRVRKFIVKDYMNNDAALEMAKRSRVDVECEKLEILCKMPPPEYVALDVKHFRSDVAMCDDNTLSKQDTDMVQIGGFFPYTSTGKKDGFSYMERVNSFVVDGKDYMQLVFHNGRCAVVNDDAVARRVIFTVKRGQFKSILLLYHAHSAELRVHVGWNVLFTKNMYDMYGKLVGKEQYIDHYNDNAMDCRWVNLRLLPVEVMNRRIDLHKQRKKGCTSKKCSTFCEERFDSVISVKPEGYFEFPKRYFTTDGIR
ncbi:MAG: hypothetical protein PHN45_00815 [Methylococcales bacterium]|nr:hypothetical protein [Methylococcales bacterium]